jgi:hypothetical protein
MFARPLDMSLAEQSKEGLDLGERFEVAARRLREANIECGRILARLAEIDGWHSAGSVCEDDFGERYGMPAKDARMLLGLGLAIKAAPYLEQSVLSGRMTLREASLLGQVLPDPRMQREGDDWVGWALTESTRTFENRVRKRREEVGLAGEETMGISLYVRRTVMEDFRRARVIASRKAGQALTEGQTLGVVVDTYLEAFDPARVTPGRRTLLDTAFVNGRYVPPAVQREIIERQGEKCAVPFCDHLMFLDKAHLVEHRCGGSREADNLLLLCSRHHDLFDWGYIRIAGTAAKPSFIDPQGRDLAQRFARRDYYAFTYVPDPNAPVITGPSTGGTNAAKRTAEMAAKWPEPKNSGQPTAQTGSDSSRGSGEPAEPDTTCSSGDQPSSPEATEGPDPP